MSVGNGDMPVGIFLLDQTDGNPDKYRLPWSPKSQNEYLAEHLTIQDMTLTPLQVQRLLACDYLSETEKIIRSAPCVNSGHDRIKRNKMTRQRPHHPRLGSRKLTVCLSVL